MLRSLCCFICLLLSQFLLFVVFFLVDSKGGKATKNKKKNRRRKNSSSNNDSGNNNKVASPFFSFSLLSGTCTNHSYTHTYPDYTLHPLVANNICIIADFTFVSQQFRSWIISLLAPPIMRVTVRLQ